LIANSRRRRCHQKAFLTWLGDDRRWLSHRPFQLSYSAVTDAWNRFTLGIELPGNWSRSGTTFVGILMSLCGLLILLRLVAIG
jgi:hypothetical protein